MVQVYADMKKTMADKVIGIGNDIIEVERIRDSLASHGEKILNRLLTQREKEYCLSMHDPAIRFAGRFAAKEAVAKALGCGFGKELSWHDVEIINNADGAPEVILSPAANAHFATPRMLVSISHSRDYASAVAIRLGW